MVLHNLVFTDILLRPLWDFLKKITVENIYCVSRTMQIDINDKPHAIKLANEFPMRLRLSMTYVGILITAYIYDG